MPINPRASAIAGALAISACGSEPDLVIHSLRVTTTTGAQSSDADINLCLTRGDTNEEVCDLLDLPLEDNFESNQEDSFSVDYGTDIDVSRAGGVPAVKNVYFMNTGAIDEPWNMTSFVLDAWIIDNAGEVDDTTSRVCAEHGISVLLRPGERYAPTSCP
ncbi:hypothetical protein [Sorangium sp. So ce861]|uniref:hypothetical protein n=1 Tax=Sorangium sp. So ce861 TaxID=3133323 RepID=UPI003F60B80B